MSENEQDTHIETGHDESIVDGSIVNDETKHPVVAESRISDPAAVASDIDNEEAERAVTDKPIENESEEEEDDEDSSSSSVSSTSSESEQIEDKKTGDSEDNDNQKEQEEENKQLVEEMKPERAVTDKPIENESEEEEDDEDSSSSSVSSTSSESEQIEDKKTGDSEDNDNQKEQEEENKQLVEEMKRQEEEAEKRQKEELERQKQEEEEKLREEQRVTAEQEMSKREESSDSTELSEKGSVEKDNEDLPHSPIQTTVVVPGRDEIVPQPPAEKPYVYKRPINIGRPASQSQDRPGEEKEYVTSLLPTSAFSRYKIKCEEIKCFPNPYLCKLLSAAGDSKSEITHLDLSKTYIGDKNAVSLAHALKDQRLVDLDISQNGIGNDGCVALCEALRGTQIRKISLQQNMISERGAKAILSLLEGTPSLLDVNYSGNPIRSRLRTRLLKELMKRK
ncbi:hypothetical protein ADUPG1_009596 [Aduncisulcus paluster]|uniref:Uncharacterized protein n=1 Tax=Aduncisulcus paluster TaxID=2918883 RepID=A0ABQ5KW80_9EUKA|nr:hypothetical protein ADUPG1_009596 [Aduncisulcus paluster]